MIYQIKKNIKEKTERKLIEAATKKINDSESAYIEPVDMFFSYSGVSSGSYYFITQRFPCKDE